MLARSAFARRLYLLVDRFRGVDNFWLDGFLVDDGNNSLVDMMVNVLTSDRRSSSLCVAHLLGRPVVFEMTKLSVELHLGVFRIVMVILSFFAREDVVGVLLGQPFLMLERLDCGVVMVLMNLTVDSFSGLLVTMWSNGLSSHGGVDGFLDGGVVAPIASDLLNGCFGCFHICGLSG